ncbi:zinc finger protein 431-like [Tachysurus ichikawai]
MKTETLDGGTEGSVKKEEILEPSISNHGNSLINTPEVKIPIKEEEADDKDFLYCEVCQSYFFKKCEVHGPAAFIPDTPVPMGVADRARQTLPSGLEIQKSSIPDSGLGVFNKGQTVPVGAHFGPYQGQMVDREEAMNSVYSWVIYTNNQCEEYIDAKRDMHANWMRYINCARHDGEQNLVAFQYQGRILYRCCRPIYPEQELLVWYEEKYARVLGPAFNYFWNKKCYAKERTDVLLPVVFCSVCTISFTSQIYLNKHMRSCHYEEYVKLQESGEIEYKIIKMARVLACLVLFCSLTIRFT